MQAVGALLCYGQQRCGIAVEIEEEVASRSLAPYGHSCAATELAGLIGDAWGCADIPIERRKGRIDAPVVVYYAVRHDSPGHKEALAVSFDRAVIIGEGGVGHFGNEPSSLDATSPNAELVDGSIKASIGGFGQCAQIYIVASGLIFAAI